MPSLHGDVLALIIALALPDNAFECAAAKRLLAAVSRDWLHVARSIGRRLAAVELPDLPAFAARVTPFCVSRPLELRGLSLRIEGQHIDDATWLLLADAVAGCASTLDNLTLGLPDWIGRLAAPSPIVQALSCVSLATFSFESVGELDFALLASSIAAWPRLRTLSVASTVNGWVHAHADSPTPSPRTALRHLNLRDFRGPTGALDALLTICAADLRSLTLGSRLYTDATNQLGDLVLAHGLRIESIDIHNGLRPLSLKSLTRLRHLALRCLSDAWGFTLARTLAGATETPIETLGVPTRAANAVEAAISDGRLPTLRTLTLYWHPPMPAPSTSEIASLELTCAIRGVAVVHA